MLANEHKLPLAWLLWLSMVDETLDLQSVHMRYRLLWQA